MLGIIGEYIGRIYDESNGRPLYIISKRKASAMVQKITAAISKTPVYKLYEKYRSFIRFAIVGCINTGVDFLTFTVLHGLFLVNKMPSQAAAYSMGVANSFVLNKLWTFEGVRPHYKTMGQLARFISINMLSLAITLAGLKFLNDTLGVNVYVSKVIITVIAQLINYLGYKLFVFGEKA